MPTIKVNDGRLVIESETINEYLEEVYGKGTTLPTDPVKKA